MCMCGIMSKKSNEEEGAFGFVGKFYRSSSLLAWRPHLGKHPCEKMMSPQLDLKETQDQIGYFWSTRESKETKVCFSNPLFAHRPRSLPSAIFIEYLKGRSCAWLHSKPSTQQSSLNIFLRLSSFGKTLKHTLCLHKTHWWQLESVFVDGDLFIYKPFLMAIPIDPCMYVCKWTCRWAQ